MDSGSIRLISKLSHFGFRIFSSKSIDHAVRQLKMEKPAENVRQIADILRDESYPSGFTTINREGSYGDKVSVSDLLKIDLLRTEIEGKFCYLGLLNSSKSRQLTLISGIKGAHLGIDKPDNRLCLDSIGKLNVDVARIGCTDISSLTTNGGSMYEVSRRHV
ncbi:uncharacterized protein [Apostichopus japonicus]|uniref:uncharacterized protein n=1 Tax=Stichopus japonicus TaxID=307972 RepID=UPI003AB130FF